MAGRILTQRWFRKKKIFIVTGSRRVGDDGRHVDDVKGHHVEVGVGVLPNRKGGRCYSGL